MKTKLSLILIITYICLSLCYAFADEKEKDAVKHEMIGYVYGSVTFNVSINDSVPFDLDSNIIQENLNYATRISGLEIGTYTLITNTVFKLYVTHDKLHLVDRTFGTTYTDSNGKVIEDPGTISEIDYRLYMETGPTGSFLSSKSDSNAYISDYSNIATRFSNQILIQGENISLPNQGIHLSLEDQTTITDPVTNETETSTAITVQKLKAGKYISNIYFYLVVES